jgi:hypothetical protein
MCLYQSLYTCNSYLNLNDMLVMFLILASLIYPIIILIVDHRRFNICNFHLKAILVMYFSLISLVSIFLIVYHQFTCKI